MYLLPDAIDDYCLAHSQVESELLKNLNIETLNTTNLPAMLCGHLQGRLLKFLVELKGAKKILELGTFTGYSALCMAEALPSDGELITCESNPNIIKDIASRYFDKSPHGHKITVKVGKALNTLPEFSADTFDFIFVDADKENYSNYFLQCLPILKKDGVLLFDNALWSGNVLSPNDNASRHIDKLNKLIKNTKSVKNILLPIRDGINIVQKC